jgi:hypothetical protein
VPANLLLLVALGPRLVELLRLGRPALQEPHGHQHEQRELEVLGLPVLHHRVAEVRREDVAAQRDELRVLVVHERVRGLFVVVEVVPDDRLEHQADQEDRQEEERQARVLDEAHQ